MTGSATDPWQVATHAGNRDAQLDSTLDATPAQRLAWLEAALRLVSSADAATRHPHPSTRSERRRVPE